MIALVVVVVLAAVAWPSMGIVTVRQSVPVAIRDRAFWTSCLLTMVGGMISSVATWASALATIAWLVTHAVPRGPRPTFGELYAMAVCTMVVIGALASVAMRDERRKEIRAELDRRDV